jgi:hypothetical protein
MQFIVSYVYDYFDSSYFILKRIIQGIHFQNNSSFFFSYIFQHQTTNHLNYLINFINSFQLNLIVEINCPNIIYFNLSYFILILIIILNYQFVRIYLEIKNLKSLFIKV